MAAVFGGLLNTIFWIVLIYIVVSYIINPRRSFGLISSRWQHHFKDMQFSAQEFYASVTRLLNENAVPNIEVDMVEHSTSKTLFSTSRIYLQVRREDQMILVCAAPFGKGSFVSWWNGEKLDFIKDFVPRIPTIGSALARYMYRKSFYQMDTENMFKEAVRACVMEVIDEMTNAHGKRGLTELERMAIDLPLTNKLK